MTPSHEYLALKRLSTPTRSRAGDMWLCRRLGIVKVFNGHKRGSRHGMVNNNFHMYHWGKPTMWSNTCQWRDNDPNAAVSDPALGRAGNGGEPWEYIGNLCDLLPYSALAGENWTQACASRKA